MSAEAANVGVTSGAPPARPFLPLPAIVLIGLGLFYLPIFQQLATSFWSLPEYSHGPLIALVSAILLWRKRRPFAHYPPPISCWAGSALFASGLLLASAGLIHDIALFSALSLVPVLAGIVVILQGVAGLRMAAFPLMFLLFMVPLPGLVVDSLTLEMKEVVSAATVHVLHAAGYPIARSGVIIVIGHYQMLVADACSGLHSLFSLSALGLLYVHLRRGLPLWRRGAMVMAIVPIAIAANLLRTVSLLLITYHAGDVAARTWHNVTGIVLFVLALTLLFGTDRLLGWAASGSRT